MSIKLTISKKKLFYSYLLRVENSLNVHASSTKILDCSISRQVVKSHDMKIVVACVYNLAFVIYNGALAYNKCDKCHTYYISYIISSI